MSSKDTLLHELSTGGSSAEPSVFLKKSMLTIQDSVTSYESAQSRISTSAISNSTYLDMKNAYLCVPLVLTISGAIDPATEATSLDFSCGLKAFNHNLLHSMSVTVNGAQVKSVTNFENMFHDFRLMSLLSANELETLGHIGFQPDSVGCVRYASAKNVNGIGISRNRVVGAFENVATAFNTYDTYNKGFLERMKATNYRAEGIIGDTTDTFASLLSSSNVAQLRRSRVYRNINETGTNEDGLKMIQIESIIPLSTFSLFENLPLMKGALFEFICNWNNVAFDVALDANKKMTTTNATVSHQLNGTNPVIFASAGASEPNSVLTASKTYRVSCYVGNKCLDTAQKALSVQDSTLSQTVQLIIPSYALNPSYESSYISSPVKEVYYKDLQHYQISKVSSGASFTELLTSGTSHLCSILIIPQYTADAHTGSSTPLTPLLSPFDSGTYPSPFATIGQFNVLVAGEPLFSEDAKYDRDLFLQEVKGARSINSSLTAGLGSGQIDLIDYQIAPYVYANLARGDEISKAVPKSVSIRGTNVSTKDVTLHVFLEVSRKIQVDVLTGQFMM